MNKNKKSITIIICVLVLLLTAIGFITYGSVRKSKKPTYTVSIEEHRHWLRIDSERLLFEKDGGFLVRHLLALFSPAIFPWGYPKVLLKNLRKMIHIIRQPFNICYNEKEFNVSKGLKT